jgi:SAM-dependent methyltransferase
MSSLSNDNLPPALRMSQLIVSLWVPQAVHAAAELGIADVLAEKPQPSRAVAERLGTHPDATDRLMRALVTLGLFARHAGDYSLTELGRCLETRATTSRRAWSRVMGGPAVWQAWGRLTDSVHSGRKAYAGADGTASPEADTFDAIASDPEGAAVFHQAMAEMTSGVAPGIARAMDFAGARRVVDVGGGYGALLSAILDAHPGLEGAVFDLPHAREGALELFASRGLGSRAAYVAGSFFETPPPPADAYVMKSVIHDWDDARSLRILGNCREALRDDARLLLIEPPAGAPDDGNPNPVRDWFLAFSDLNMLVNTGGRERTEAEYVALLEAAKLRVTAVRETPTYFRVFESVRA